EPADDCRRDQRDAERERRRVAALAAERADDNPDDRDSHRERRDASHARLPAPHCGTTNIANRSNAAVPNATLASSHRPAPLGRVCAELGANAITGKPGGMRNHARAAARTSRNGEARLAPVTLPASRTSRYGGSNPTAATEKVAHAPHVTSSRTATGC